MNGPQDLGGQMGFGPVAPDPHEPKFHAPWEKRALGVTIGAGALGGWSLDESRAVREALHPAEYYNASYYEIWTKALEKLLVRHGFATWQELGEGRALGEAAAPMRVLRAAEVAPALAKGSPCDRAIGQAPAFAVGDAVRMKNMHPEGHTRLPRYVRGRAGRIEAVNGAHVFPDTNAHGQGEQPQYLYTVVFDGRELWGEASDPALTVSVDAWESYIERA